MYKIELTEQDYQIVMSGLGEMKASISIGVISRINDQVRKQRDKIEKETEDAKGTAQKTDETSK